MYVVLLLEFKHEKTILQLLIDTICFISLLPHLWLYLFFYFWSHPSSQPADLKLTQATFKIITSPSSFLWMLSLRVGFGVFCHRCAIRTPMVVFNGKRREESHFRRWFIWRRNRRKISRCFPLRSHINTALVSSNPHLCGLTTQTQHMVWHS